MNTLEQLYKKTVAGYCLTLFISALSPLVGYLMQPVDNQSELGITLQSVSIMLLLAFTPAGLKLFDYQIKKMQNINDKNTRLTKYFQWFSVRLTMVALPLFLNVALYFPTRNNSMLFCAGISAIALIFCKPSKNKMSKELNISENE